MSLGLSRWGRHAPLATALSSAVLSLRAAPCKPSARLFASASAPVDIKHLRNIGISAHIDSGKTTLTERILFYTGRISQIHDVKGKDGVGAKMDSMELEREKGITIQSAATFCNWINSKTGTDYNINIIDTPGHVDFTIEVERALRVLDGAILVVCSVGGVQSQTMTVDRQMKRYNVPRLSFINKCDRAGADPFRVIGMMRTKLKLRAVPIQIPIGLEAAHIGSIDLITRRAYTFFGDNGEKITEGDIPADLVAQAEEKRKELIEAVADVDDTFGELFLMEEFTEADVQAAVRRATIAGKIVPVLMGSAYKNRGVQLLLDAVTNYLPSPVEREYVAKEVVDSVETSVPIICSPSKALVALAFKLQETRFGQLTYMRLYQGKIKKGDTIAHVTRDQLRKIKVARLIRMHSDEMQDIEQADAGDIVALFGIDCASGDTFTGGQRSTMESMFVPEPVMSLAVAPKSKSAGTDQFFKALQRFQREDPTFRVTSDAESNETIISGMGELHLQIYVERLKREYNLECVAGMPRVNYRETCTTRAEFNYLHRKQSGGSGQYARVIGYLEPNDEQTAAVEFANGIIGNVIPPEFIAACSKGFIEASTEGPLIGHLVTGVKVVLTDGATHVVDSSEQAFRTAAKYAFRQGFASAVPQILEPLMEVEIEVPEEYQGSVMGAVNKRNGLITNTDNKVDFCTITCEVPLSMMFGFSTDLRSMTQGKGEFQMEYLRHAPVPMQVQKLLVADYAKNRKNKDDD